MLLVNLKFEGLLLEEMSSFFFFFVFDPMDIANGGRDAFLFI